MLYSKKKLLYKGRRGAPRGAAGGANSRNVIEEVALCVSLSRVRGLTLDSAMNNWPLLHLYEYMTSKYRGVVSHTPTTTHWLQNAINWTFHPATVDFIKLLTLT